MNFMTNKYLQNFHASYTFILQLISKEFYTGNKYFDYFPNCENVILLKVLCSCVKVSLLQYKTVKTVQNDSLVV